MNEEYEEFGDEWETFVMKMRKKDIVEMLRDALIKDKSACEFIWYAGEIVGVEKHNHRSSHGFKVLQRLKDLSAIEKQDKPATEAQA